MALFIMLGGGGLSTEELETIFLKVIPFAAVVAAIILAVMINVKIGLDPTDVGCFDWFWCFTTPGSLR